MGGFGLSAHHPLLTGSKLLLEHNLAILGRFSFFHKWKFSIISVRIYPPIIYNGYIHYIHAKSTILHNTEAKLTSTISVWHRVFWNSQNSLSICCQSLINRDSRNTSSGLCRNYGAGYLATGIGKQSPGSWPWGAKVLVPHSFHWSSGSVLSHVGPCECLEAQKTTGGLWPLPLCPARAWTWSHTTLSRPHLSLDGVATSHCSRPTCWGSILCSQQPGSCA